MFNYFTIMANKTQHYKKALLEALEKTLGVVTTACEKVGVNRSTYYDYYNNDEDFKNSVDSISDQALDFVESKLFERINGYEHPEDKVFNNNGVEMVVPVIKHYPPDPTSMIFYLKTKGKKRGYIEKTEIDVNQNNIQFILPEGYED